MLALVLQNVDGTLAITNFETAEFSDTPNVFEYGASWNLLYTTSGGVQIGGAFDFTTSRIRRVDEFNQWDQDQIFLRLFAGYHF